MKAMFRLCVLLLCLGCLACAPVPVKEVTAVPGPPPASVPETDYSAALGKTFVRLALDRAHGRAELSLVGHDGAPRSIDVRHLDATLRLPGGKLREAAFEPAVHHKGPWPESRFELRDASLRGSEALTLTVDIPLNGTHYRVKYECPETTNVLF